MLVVGGILAALAGLFYLAGNNEIGALGSTMCLYGRPFCDQPVYVLVAAGMASLWGNLVSV